MKNETFSMENKKTNKRSIFVGKLI